MLVSLLADALVLLALLTLTVALLGAWRLPDLPLRLHAITKIGSLGLAALLLSTIFSGEPELALRGLLIAAFLVWTTPVSTHAVASAHEEESRASGTETASPR